MGERKITNVLNKIDYVLCVLLSLVFTVSPYYISSGECKFNFSLIMLLIFNFIVFLLSTWILRYHLINLQKFNGKSSKFIEYGNKLLSHKYALPIVAISIFICWLPVLICLYPGTLINDTWGQLQQFISFTSGNGGLSDHHPIFDTFWIGGFIVPLAKLTGRWHIAIFLYVLIQALLTSFAFACSILYFYRNLKLNSKIVMIILLFYCFLPCFPASAQTVSKDALFSWIFVLFFVLFLEVIRSGGEVLKNTRFLFTLSALAVLCCLTKKIGMYVVLLSLISLILFQKKYRVKMLIPFANALAIMLFVLPLFQEKFDITPGGKQEMFSIPFQQTARYVKEYGDDITEEEYVILDKVLTMENLADRYEPTNADPVKDFYQKGEDEDYAAYLKVWICQGIRHPDAYVDALLSMISGWFSWTEYDPLMSMEWHSQLNPSVIPETAAIRGMSEESAKEYRVMYHYLYSNPIIGILLTYGLYAALIPAFALGTVFRRWKNRKVTYWLAIVPVLLSIILGCWLAPVSIHFEGRRYLYPVVYTAPIVIAWCIYVYKENSLEIEEKTLEENS